MSQSVRTTLFAVAIAVLSAVVLILLAWPAHAAGSAEVRFVEPERFSDAGRGSHERERTLASLTDHLQMLAQRLPAGQRLRVEILDIDLAGEQILRRGGEVRVLRGAADWPQMHLRWTLEQGGSTLKSGQERLSEIGYLTNSRIGGAASDGDMPYEKGMLTKWFRNQFEGGR